MVTAHVVVLDLMLDLHQQADPCLLVGMLEVPSGLLGLLVALLILLQMVGLVGLVAYLQAC